MDPVTGWVVTIVGETHINQELAEPNLICIGNIHTVDGKQATNISEIGLRESHEQEQVTRLLRQAGSTDDHFLK